MGDISVDKMRLSSSFMRLAKSAVPHNPAAISAPPERNGRSILPINRRQEYNALLNTLLALLAVVVVMAIHGVVRLVFLPFRAVRALFRHGPAQSQLTAR